MPSNLGVLRQRIVAAAERAGRDPSSVTLLPVTKYLTLEQVRELRDLGVTRMAESRAQQLAARSQEMPDVEWVMIGRVQTNKAGVVVRSASSCESVSSVRIAEALSRRAESDFPILLQVNVSGEESKAGFAPEQVPEALRQISELPFLTVEGFMTIAPLEGGLPAAQSTFRRLRELREESASICESLALPPLQTLSMGMTGDFETAIAEGATEVRIGSALFTD